MDCGLATLGQPTDDIGRRFIEETPGAAPVRTFADNVIDLGLRSESLILPIGHSLYNWFGL